MRWETKSNYPVFNQSVINERNTIIDFISIKIFKFNIIIDLHIVVRNNTETHASFPSMKISCKTIEY